MNGGASLSTDRVTALERGRPLVARAVSMMAAGVMLAAGLVIGSAPTPASAAAPLSCTNTVYIASSAASNVRRMNLTTGAIDPTPVFTTNSGVGSSINQLGIGADGSYAMIVGTAGIGKFTPAASEAGTLNTSRKAGPIPTGTVGAVNPLTGLHYYGAYSGATLNLYVHDPATGASPAGPVVSVTLTNPPGTNGDIAFDKLGRLFMLNGNPTTSGLFVANGVVPTSGTGTVLTSQEISRSPVTAAPNGVAFGSDGFLYIGGVSTLQKANPITGAPVGAPRSFGTVTSNDLGSCANPSSAEVMAEFDGPRARPTDAVRIILEGGSYGANGTSPDFPATRTTDNGGADSDAGLIIPGETYTATQQGLGTTDLGMYDTTWVCTDGDGATISSGTGNTATFTAPTGTDGINIVCAFTNVVRGPTATPDAAFGVFGAPVVLDGATDDQAGGAPLAPELTVFTSPDATDGGRRLETPQGVWTLDAEGRATFTPAPGFTGDAVTEYRVVDANGLESTATLTATIRPGPAAAADTAATTQGQQVRIPVLDNDAAGQNADGTAGTIPPGSVVFPTAGQPTGATVSPDGRRLTVPGEGVYTIDPATGAVTFAPAATFTGTTTPVAYGFTDSTGNAATAQIQVTVAGQPPVGVDDAARTAQATPVTVDVLANDEPGPGGALDPASVVFTDPAATDGGRRLVTAQGEWLVTDGGEVEFRPAPGFAGTATAPYSATDPSGQQATATVSVTVLPGPVANTDTATTDQNVDVVIPILDNDVPGEGPNGPGEGFDRDSVRFVVTPALPAGSAATADGRVLTVPGEGVYTFDPATGRVTFDPEPQFTGAATPVTYSVTDAFGNPASSTISVSVTAVVPVATGDAAKTPGDVPVVIDALANDIPGAPDAPLVASTMVFTSPDATDGGKTLVVDGEGTYTIRDDGSVRFVPDEDFTGRATPVEYRVSDTNGTPTTATIEVMVGSRAIAAPDSAAVPQNTPVEIDVLGNDHASDLGAPCDPGQTDVPQGCDTGTMVPTSVTFPTEGQPAGAVVSADGRTITMPGEGVYTVNPTTGAVTFVPEPAFTGVSTPVVYSALDSHGAPVSSTIMVVVDAITPVAADDRAATTFGTPVTVDLLANDRAGADSAPLVPAQTVFPAAGQPEGATVSADGKTLTVPGQGTYTLDATGAATFTPEAGYSGTTTPVAYRVVDANGTTADARLMVTVRPGPTAERDTITTPQGVAVALSPLANDVPSRNADGSEGAWDPSTLRFPSEGQPPGSVLLDDGRRLVVPNEGFYVAAVDGTVTFTPLPEFRGRASTVSYTASDAVGGAVTSTIRVTVDPVTPTAADDDATTAFATPVTIDFIGNDTAGDPSVPLDPTSATFEAADLPAGVTAEIRDDGKTVEIAGEGVYTLGADGTVLFTPAAGFSGATTPVRYTIRDANGTAATAAIGVTVRPGPIGVADAERTSRNVPVTVDVLRNDTPGQRADGSAAEFDSASVVFPPDGQPDGAVLGADGKTIDVPGQGAYAIDADGRVTFTPLPTFTGSASPVRYAATDSLGNVAASTLTVTVVGDDPIARDNVARTSSGVPVVIDVLGDDTPGTGGAALDPASLRIVGPDGALVLTLDVPGEGEWRVVSGRIVFTPDPDFSGRASITYSVADVNGTRVTARVTVIVARATAGGALPATGGEVPWIGIGAAAVLLAAGGLLIVRPRRRATD